MRLRSLSLARYGKFTDKTIEFGAAVDGMPDLHVVYGPNEAGKSTLLSAFLDLLFGIELQSRYGFLHPYETMRVGGCLDLSDGPRELVRIKKPQPTLRDAAGQPIAQTLLAGELGGLDRAAYRAMFSLDDETLESGGESILASNGEVGQLLFSATAGLAELSRTLLAVRASADGFTRPNARSGELHELKAMLATLKLEREAIDTQAAQYVQMARARDDASGAYETALSELSAGQMELARVRRLRVSLPRLAACRGFQEKLERFGDLPVVPETWETELTALEQADSRHRSATEQTTTEVARLTAVLEGITVDAAALRRSGSLASLEFHAARNLTAERDLPLRRADLARADEAVKGILARIGRENEGEPSRLLLTAAQSAALDALMGKRSGIEAKLAAANDELIDAVRGLSEARRALGANEPPPAGALALLTAALAAWRASDHAFRLRTGLRAQNQHAEALQTRLSALQPWSGDAVVLAALVLPNAKTVQGWQDDVDRRASQRALRQDRIDRMQAELTTRKAELRAANSVVGLLSDQEAAEVRVAREAAWAQHRRSLDGQTADDFEAALRRDDIVSGTRLGHERDLAKLHETAQVVLMKEAELAEENRLQAKALDDQQRQVADVQAAIAAIDPALLGLPVAAFVAWITRRNDGLETWQNLRTVEQDVAEARADEAALKARLKDALAQAAVPFDQSKAAEVLAVVAQEVLEREARLQLLRKDVAECEANFLQREVAFDKASRSDATWRDGWLTSCSGCWLGAEAAAKPLETVKAVVAAASELRPAIAKQFDLAGRIRDMQDDQTNFSREVDQLAAEMGIPIGGGSATDIAREIVERVQGATRADAQRKQLQDALAKAQDKDREVQRDARTHASRVGEMMRALQAVSLIEVAGKLRDIREKADLTTQAAEAERELLTTLDVVTLPEAKTLLDGQSEAALEGEEARLSAHHQGLELRARKLFADRQTAIDSIAAVGGDDAAAVIEERRRTQMLEIEDKAQQYLRLRVGIAAADRALRAYRDRHRSSMMRQASEAFRLISRDAYRGLGTQPGKDGEVLIALGADGGSKLAADLSKGTRFQLYLALRAAGYHEFAKVRPTVPFIADDIMETFDDFRAEETLKVLHEMSRLGQVIYLTHHSHLRDIAKRSVPGVRIHELDP